MGKLDDDTGDQTTDEAADPLLKALAWTPRVAPFTGTERYRVRCCLGEGGFGVVYEVDDLEVGRVRALKTLKAQPTGFASAIQRLKREFRTAADLVHRNLVGLHELSSDGPRWFFTMDLVRGCGLLDYIRGAESQAGAGFSEPRLRACLAQLVDGVSALHQAGIVHRDLKPSNVLVEPDGRVVILDFGLADGENQTEPELLSAGTPRYMAPEQRAGRAPTAAADWYAVGVMLQQALTGGSRSADRPSAHPAVPSDLAELCRALLRPDPEARPDAAAIRAMLGGAPPRADGETRRAEVQGLFVGRADEMRALEAGCDAVEGGAAHLVRLHGQPGVGKSTLLGRFLDRVRDGRRALVLAGRCHERESVPFKALDGVMDVLVRYLRSLPASECAALLPPDIHLASQLFPALESVPAVRDAPRRPGVVPDPRELRGRAFGGLKELVSRLASDRLLVIAIDDLQWGDIDSARLLAQLVGPPDRPPILVALAYRSDEAQHNPTLRETLEVLSLTGTTTSDIALAPFPPADAETLARALLGSDGDAPLGSRRAARAIAERGEGHPLFIAELARAHRLLDSQVGTPPTLIDILWQRVGRLSAGARALLETVAVAGRPLASSLCFEAAGLGAGGLDAVRVLRAEQLVRAGDRGDINVFHDRVRDAVLLRSDADTRRHRHIALARTLERSAQPDLEALARHFDAADQPQKAADYAVRAGDAAMNGLAFDRAAQLYQMAIDRGRDPSSALYEKLGYALLNAGRSVAAGEAFQAAAGRVPGPSAHKTELMRLAAEHLMVVGNVDAGFAALEEALSAVGERLPTSSRQAVLMMLAHTARVRIRRTRFRERAVDRVPSDQIQRLDVLDSACRALMPTDPVRAMGMLGRFHRSALAAGEPRRAGRALVGSVPCSIGFARCRPALADQLLDAAWAIGERYSDDELLGRVIATRGMLHFTFNDWVSAAELSERAAAHIAERCRGMTNELHDALLIAANSHMRSGRFEEARRLGEALLLVAVELDDPVYQKQVCAGVLAPLRLVADDPEEARRLVEEVGMEPRCPTIVMRAEASVAVAMYCGRPRDGVAAWRAVWGRIKQMGIMVVAGMRLWVARSLASALIAGAEGPHEIREAARLTRSLRRVRFPAARGAYALLRSLLTAREGDAETAAALLAEAAGHLEEAGMPQDAAACRYRHGLLVGGDAGAAEVADADQAMRRLGIADPARWAGMLVPDVSPVGRRLLAG